MVMTTKQPGDPRASQLLTIEKTKNDKKNEDTQNLHSFFGLVSFI